MWLHLKGHQRPVDYLEKNRTKLSCEMKSVNIFQTLTKGRAAFSDLLLGRAVSCSFPTLVRESRA